jgi:hypothetical protein
MFKVILKGKFKERRIDLSIVSRVMYHQPFTGSIQKEHITWWKRYWIKPIMLEILYPSEGWIQLVKVYRDGKPSIRVITKPSTSGKRELLVYKKLYGKEKDTYELKNRTNKKVQYARKMSVRNN